MANSEKVIVEIYRLKKTVPDEVRKYGMFEFFGLAYGPLPKNYVREYKGELSTGKLSDILGRTYIDPPVGYLGGPLVISDIVVVDGQAYFFDYEPGRYYFAEIEFDTSEIKPALYVGYGHDVLMEDAVQIPRALSLLCESVHIPVGYKREPDYHGSYKGLSSFEPLSSNECSLSNEYSVCSNLYSPCYLHPEFLKGREGQVFIDLLTELSATEAWGEIAGYLRENYPLGLSDLERARELYVTELLPKAGCSG